MCSPITFDNTVDYMTFDAAVEVLPRIGGKAISHETVRRWASEGLRGVVLESYSLGGRRLTTMKALSNFLAEVAKTR